MKYSHLFLKNPTGIKNYVSTTRVIEKTDDEEEELIKKDYTYQKEKLKSNLDFFMRDRNKKKKNRTLDLPFHFEYIEIHFFVQFNKDFGDTKDYYQKLFGLQPVSYRDFNKTVLFYIENTRLFQKFIDLVEMFFNSTADEIPEDQDYHAITLIYSFDFLSSSKINEIRGDKIILTLTERIKNAYGWEVIKANLFRYIESREGKVLELTDGIWELSNMINYIHEITNNFDIIQKAQSIPPIRVTPSSFNLTRFSWGFETIPNESLPIVGVIDSGIDKNVEPLKPLLVGEESILDRPKGISSSHGTNVASLIAFGKNLITPETPKEPVANLYSIQVLCEEEGNFSYNELKNAIINAHKKYNIRIFNLSVCDPIGFEYNASLSKYAMMLDELAYKYDLLIFIATGNLNEDYRDYIVNEVGRGTHLINYPNHFYNAINHDYSQPTNLGSPSESMNNITVGAIACNNFDNKTDLTDYHTLPAYYTRKYYVDYSQKINGSKFNKNQMNKNIFKPDILMPGGDWSDLDSKMIVLGRGHVPKDYYNRLSGTSLATPLAANIAAKVLFKYPILNMQSVKALLINSSITTNIEGLITNIIEQCKETEAQKVHGCSFSRLSQGEKMNLSTMYNSRRFSKYIEGHGVVNEDNCLNSNEKRVTFVIEDSIKFKQHKVQHIKT